MGRVRFVLLALSFGLVLAVLSGYVFRSRYEAMTGNLCPVTEGNPYGLCYQYLPQAGFPRPFLKDSAGTSVIGSLGIEDDFSGSAFLLDAGFFAVISAIVMAATRRRTGLQS